MKKYLLYLLLISSLLSVARAGNDPVGDYLGNIRNTSLRGDDTFYADDKIFVLNLDLEGNGQIERLVSSSLDRDGKAGNMWTVYNQEKGEWKKVGNITFHASGFYLGKIDQLNGQYGVVSFFPSGNQEGSLLASVFDGTTVQQTKIGEVERDPITRQLKGTALMHRYFGGPGDTGHPVIKTMEVGELAKTYGLKSESKKFEDVMREQHEAAIKGQ